MLTSFSHLSDLKPPCALLCLKDSSSLQFLRWEVRSLRVVLEILILFSCPFQSLHGSEIPTIDISHPSLVVQQMTTVDFHWKLWDFHLDWHFSHRRLRCWFPQMIWTRIGTGMNQGLGFCGWEIYVGVSDSAKPSPAICLSRIRVVTMMSKLCADFASEIKKYR